MIWAVTSWNSHFIVYSKHDLLIDPMLCFDRRAPAYASPFWRVLDFDAAIRSWKPRQNNDEKCICRAKMTKSRHPCDRICFQRLSVCKGLAALCVTSSAKGTYPLGQQPNQVPSNGLEIATRVVIGCEGNVKSGRFACFFSRFYWYNTHPSRFTLTSVLKIVEFVDQHHQNTRYRQWFVSATRQIFVYLWGPILMGPYNIQL